MRTRMGFPLGAVLLLFLCSGCTPDLSTDYGKSKGIGHTSLNGFAALRKSYEHAGYRSRDVTRLSNRVKRTDVIVWTPQVLGAINTEVTGWFERWLRSGNKTLVYVLPDSGSETDYWAHASKLAPPAQRLEYRKRKAKSINQTIRWRQARQVTPSNGWFSVTPKTREIVVQDLSGQWKQEIVEGNDNTVQGQHPKKQIVVELDLAAYDTKQAATAAPTAGTAPTVGFGAGTGPGAPNFNFASSTRATTTSVTFSPSLYSSGNTLIGTVESKNWKDSRIIVVAGGSLLTNYAFTHEFNQSLANQLIKESTPSTTGSPLVGFLTSTWASVPVSESKPGIPRASGMELLTTWPLSFVTMHGVLLGLVICLMLLPIYCRPKKVDQQNHSDFGDHLDSVAALMNKAGGERYARERISEYMTRVRGETVGPWVVSELQRPKAAAVSSTSIDQSKNIDQNQEPLSNDHEAEH